MSTEQTAIVVLEFVCTKRACSAVMMIVQVQMMSLEYACLVRPKSKNPRIAGPVFWDKIPTERFVAWTPLRLVYLLAIDFAERPCQDKSGSTLTTTLVTGRPALLRTRLLHAATLHKHRLNRDHPSQRVLAIRRHRAPSPGLRNSIQSLSMVTTTWMTTDTVSKMKTMRRKKCRAQARVLVRPR